MWKVLVVGGGRDGLCEKSPDAAPCEIRATSSWLQRDLPLTRAEPVSDTGWASVRADLRKGEKNCYATAAGREE